MVGAESWSLSATGRKTGLLVAAPGPQEGRTGDLGGLERGRQWLGCTRALWGTSAVVKGGSG